MSEPTSLDELLAHEGFLRALVRGLVHGEAEVDDVLQETFTIALRRGPREPRALRGWLARVARNVAFGTRRADARRVRREAAAARPEGIPSPLEILEREATRRRLVHTVLALDGIYRDPIVLRWLEGLSVPEVAARLGVPLETARTRLRRGLERIRERLDERSAGDRRAWIAAFAPLAGPRPTPVPPAAVSHAGPSSALRILTPTTTALLGTAALAVCTAVLLLSADPRRPGDVSSDPAVLSASAGHGARLAAAGTVPGAPGAGPTAAPPFPPETLDRSQAFAPGARPVAVLRGIVVGADGSTPAAGVAIAVEEIDAATPDPLASSGARGATFHSTTDRDGHFAIGGVPAGAWRVHARGADGAEGTGIASATLDAGPGAVWTRLALDPAPAAPVLRVRVLGPEGRAVVGARVALEPDDGSPTLLAVTDGAGLAGLEFAGEGDATLNVASDGHVGWRRLPGRSVRRHETEPWLVTLASGGRIRGAVRDGTGSPVGRVGIQAWRWTSTWDGPPVRGMRVDATSDADGSFVLDGLAPGVHVLVLVGVGLVLADVPGASDGGLRWVRVRPGADASLDLRVVPGGVLAGKVVDERGAPLPGARVELSLPLGAPFGPSRAEEDGTPVWALCAPWPAAADHPYGRRTIRTDAAGAYAFDGLPTSAAWRLVVSASGRAFDARAAVAVRARETVTLEHALEPAGTLEALVPRGATVLVRRDGEARPVAVLTLPTGATGAVRLPGLAPGGYALSLRSWRPDGTVTPLPFEIRPGASTFVDASTRVAGRTRLSLRRGGSPLPGAWLTSGSEVRIADADGRVDAPGGAGGGVPVVASVRAPDRDAVRLEVSWPAPEWETPSVERVLDLPDGRVRLRVVHAGGRPVAGAVARLSGSGFALGADASAAVDERRLTDTEGLASFSGLPAGAFDLAVEGAPSLARASRAVRVPEEEAVVEIVLRHP